MSDKKPIEIYEQKTKDYSFKIRIYEDYTKRSGKWKHFHEGKERYILQYEVKRFNYEILDGELFFVVDENYMSYNDFVSKLISNLFSLRDFLIKSPNNFENTPDEIELGRKIFREIENVI